MSLYTFKAMLKKEWYEQYRTYRIFIAAIVLLSLGLSAPIITKLTPDLLQNLGNGIKITLPPQTANDALGSYIKNMLQLPPLMLILLAMGSIADERSRGTAITVLTKPVPRSIFILSKFLIYALVLLLCLTLTAVSTYGYISVLFSQLAVGSFLLINLALLLMFLLVLAMTLLASVLFRNAIAAGGLAFVGFLLVSILPSLNATIAQALPSVLLSSTRLPQVLNGTLVSEDLWLPLASGLGITVILLVVACLIFQRQEV